jgi:hypothetical protein
VQPSSQKVEHADLKGNSALYVLKKNWNMRHPPLQQPKKYEYEKYDT